MEPFKYHVYVCNQQKPEGVPGCSAHGSDKLIDLLRMEIGKQGLGDTVQVTTCGSIGLCERGPNMIVYPDGIWYSGVTIKDLPEIISEHFKSGKPVARLVNTDAAALKSEISGNKQKMLAALKAQDAAGALPEDFQQKYSGFRISRIILTAVELDIFTAVGEKSGGAEIAKRLDTDARATEMLLNALVALNLLEKKDGLFFNTPMSRRYLMDGSPDDSRASLMHSVNLWDRWSTLTECIKKGTSVTFKDFTEREKGWADSFIAAMHKNAGARAPLIARMIGIDGFEKVLDVGGGSGAYSIAFAQANPQLQAEVFDLQDVTAIAQGHIKEAGLGDRVKIKIGDFRKDDFGSELDMVFISAICHMNNPQENIDLLRKSFDALSPGGKVVIQDFILNPDKASPTIGTLFSLNMLVATRAGASYSEDEYSAWLDEVGFQDIKKINLPGPTDLIVATRK